MATFKRRYVLKKGFPCICNHGCLTVFKDPKYVTMEKIKLPMVFYLEGSIEKYQIVLERIPKRRGKR